MNNELIQECYNSQVGEYLEVKRIENLIQWKYNIDDLRN